MDTHQRHFVGDNLRLASTSAILREYGEVLERPEFAAALTAGDRLAIFIKLRGTGLRVESTHVPEFGWPDGDDISFVAASLATEHKGVVMLNFPDIVLASALGVRDFSRADAHRAVLWGVVNSHPIPSQSTPESRGPIAPPGVRPHSQLNGDLRTGYRSRTLLTPRSGGGIQSRPIYIVEE